jgi:hypothetical protein
MIYKKIYGERVRGKIENLPYQHSHQALMHDCRFYVEGDDFFFFEGGGGEYAKEEERKKENLNQKKKKKDEEKNVNEKERKSVRRGHGLVAYIYLEWAIN